MRGCESLTTDVPNGQTGTPTTAVTPASLLPGAVAAKAASIGESETLVKALRQELTTEIGTNGNNAALQYEQAILWRRINFVIGLVVGITAAASGLSGVVGKSTVAAAVLGALATFSAGSLTALNAGQRSSRAGAAGHAYREIEARELHLRNVQLDFAEPADILQELESLQARRQVIGQTAEPPSARAFRRVDRENDEKRMFHRTLTFAERHRWVWWTPRPELKYSEVQQQNPAD